MPAQVTVTGQGIRSADGSLASGTIEFALTADLHDAAGNVVVTRKAVVVDVTAGVMTPVDLYSNADPDVLPAGTSYRVTQRLDGLARVWHTIIPLVATVDYADLPPAVLADPRYTYALDPHMHGLDDLSDVDLTGAAANDVLLFDGAEWTPAPPGAASHPDLAAHNTLGLATQAELDAHAATSHGTAHPDLAAHDALGLATDAELASHAADTTAVHGIADTSLLATDAEVATAVADHAAAADPHAGYVLESVLTESIQDVVGAMATDSATVDFTYDDIAGTLTAVVQELTSASVADFSEAVDDRVSALLVAGANITLTYDDVANTLTVAVTGVATSADLTAHTSDTTGVHGIADTANLLESGDAAGGVLSGTYPNPGFAVDMATQAELDAHSTDTTSVHGITDTSALETTTGAQAKVDAHTGDTTDAHPASAVTNTPAGTIAATTVQAAINELDTEKVATSVLSASGKGFADATANINLARPSGYASIEWTVLDSQAEPTNMANNDTLNVVTA